MNYNRVCQRCNKSPDGLYYCEDEAKDIWTCLDCMVIERDEAKARLRGVRSRLVAQRKTQIKPSKKAVIDSLLFLIDDKNLVEKASK